MNNKLLITSLLAGSVFLNCCAPVVTAGVAAGGAYYVAKDKRSVGTIIDDAAITTEVKRRFLADKKVSVLDIHVDTNKGYVTLSGNINSYESAKRAVDLARGVKGVRSVISKITVIP